MASYIIFDRATGTIRTNFSCPESEIALHLEANEAAIEHIGVSDAEFMVDPETFEIVPIGTSE